MTQTCLGAPGRQRKGVASTFLAERWSGDQTAGLYIQSQQKHFFIPRDPNTPMIMVGPGTGIAPFRGFIAHRLATGAKGKNWLFFGERKSSQDFFYREYFEKLMADNFLKMSLAWKCLRTRVWPISHKRPFQSTMPTASSRR